MPSRSLNNWRTVRVAELDEIENAHRKVGGILRGRRYATIQINHAYATLVSAQFQGYCRDLHSECVRHLVSKIEVTGIAPYDLRNVLQEEFISKRKLDSGNPNPGNLGEDFNRLGIDFWTKVKAHNFKNAQRQSLILELNVWRNAIAHQKFASLSGGSGSLPISRVRIWRKACEDLAVDFDAVMSAHIGLLIGSPPS